MAGGNAFSVSRVYLQKMALAVTRQALSGCYCCNDYGYGLRCCSSPDHDQWNQPDLECSRSSVPRPSMPVLVADDQPQSLSCFVVCMLIISSPG